MVHPELGWLAAAAIAAAWLLVGLARRARRWWTWWRRRRRVRRAFAGERDAERVLERCGYRIEARQPAITWTVSCDGEPWDIDVRADLLVSRGGAWFVAEVKTGARAPSIETAATRRQLLEYSIAYEVDGALLVDMESGTVREVVFPRGPGA